MSGLEGRRGQRVAGIIAQACAPGKRAPRGLTVRIIAASGASRPAAQGVAMFDKLTSRLSGAVEALRGRGRLTEDNINDTLRQVRMALLEADVALPVVKPFIEAVKGRALGAAVQTSLTPGQVFIKILHEELVRAMGEPGSGLNLRAQPPVVGLA